MKLENCVYRLIINSVKGDQQIIWCGSGLRPEEECGGLPCKYYAVMKKEKPNVKV